MGLPTVVFPSLREKMKNAEESAMDISRLLKVSHGSALNKLSGKTAFTLPELRMLAEHYNESIDSLFAQIQDTA